MLVNTGIGVSQKDNLIAAAKEAAEKAKQKLGDNKPKLLMFFVLYTYPREQYRDALRVIYEVFGDKKIPLVGGTVMGFFAKNKYYFDVNIFGRMTAAILGKLGKIIKPLKFNGVSVLALHSEYLSVGTGIGLKVLKDPEKVGKECINMALANLEYNPSIAYMAMLKKGAKDITRFRPINGLLLTMGMVPETIFVDEQILGGITSVTKNTVRLIGGGGCSGISGKTLLPGYLFFNEEVHKEAVIAVLFGSDLEIGYGTATGIKTLGPGAVITKVKGDYMIYELNNRPATEVLGEMIEKHTEIKKEEFMKFPLYAFTEGGYLFATREPRTGFYWPLIFGDIIENKYIKSSIPIKEGIGISLTKITLEFLQEATAEATQTMIDDIKSQNFGFIFFFSCALRGQILKRKYSEEIGIIRKVLKDRDVPIFGICSVGEQAFCKTLPMVGTQVVITMMGISNQLISEIRE